MENLVSVADRLQWAINLGQEHDASPYQRALLSYIAFRSGPENAGAWPSREKISREHRDAREHHHPRVVMVG